MEDFIKYQRRIAIVISALVLAGAVALYLFLPAMPEYALGAIWGGLGGLVTYRMRVLAIYRYMENPQVLPGGGFKIMIVMIVTLVLWVLLVRYAGWKTFSGAAVLGGLFCPNIVLMLDGFMRGKPLAEPTKEDTGEA